MRSAGDLQSPIRFPSPSGQALHLFSLEVLDRDRNAQLDGSDRYFLSNHVDHTRRELSPELGQRILHYFCDPQVLAQRREYLQVWNQRVEESNLPSSGSFASDIREIQELRAERADLRQPHLFWSDSNRLDLRLLRGERSFSAEENRRYTNLWASAPTMWNRFNGRFFWDRVAKTTGLFAGVFLGGERLIHSAFMWEMYSSNFLFSMVPGSVMEGFNLRTRLARNLNSQNAALTNEDRLAMNLQSGTDRLRLLEDHLYWFVNTPILAYGCLRDKNFISFMRDPVGNFRSNMLRRFGGSRLALAGSPLAWGAAALSAFAVYETTSLWFDRLGGLKQGTWANRVASATSTLLTESALLSRVSMEMGAFTTRTAFRAASFGEMGLARFGLGAYWRGAAASGVEGGLLRPLGTTFFVGIAAAGLVLGVGYATGLIDRRSGLGQFIGRCDQAITNFLD